MHTEGYTLLFYETYLTDGNWFCAFVDYSPCTIGGYIVRSATVRMKEDAQYPFPNSSDVIEIKSMSFSHTSGFST